jgi:hypothetical protein
LLSSLLKTTSPTTPAGASLTRLWSFKPSVGAIDAFQTYTLQKGTAAQAEQLVYAVVNALTMRWTDVEASLTGTIQGQVLSESITITPTPTDIAALPVDPKSASVYVGSSTSVNEVQTLLINGATGTFVLTYEGQSTAAQAVAVTTANLQTALQGLSTVGTNNATVTGVAGTNYVITFTGDLAGIDASTLVVSGFTGGPPTITTTTPGGLTKLSRVSSFEFAMPERYVFPMTLNDADPSFSYVIPKAVEPRATMILEHDSAAAALMADLRARNTRYCRILCRGPAVEAGFPNRFSLTFPFKYITNTRADAAGVYSSTYTLAAIYDPTFAGFMQADVSCGITAL